MLALEQFSYAVLDLRGDPELAPLLEKQGETWVSILLFEYLIFYDFLFIMLYTYVLESDTLFSNMQILDLSD